MRECLTIIMCLHENKYNTNNIRENKIKNLFNSIFYLWNISFSFFLLINRRGEIQLDYGMCGLQGF